MQEEDLYQRLDEDEDLTDQERREIYFAEIENDEEYEEWKENY